MTKSFTLNDIDEAVRGKIYTQNYKKEKEIAGVKIILLENIISEDGDFSEIIRINKEGFVENISDFKLTQMNRSKMLPNTIKAWHLHLKQNEIWFVPPESRLLIGLWDIRKDSPTKNQTMRLVLGGDKSELLYIPKGVAHGSCNQLNKTVVVIYFTDQLFNRNEADEKRIPWDTLGKEFWQPKKD